MERRRNRRNSRIVTLGSRHWHSFGRPIRSSPRPRRLRRGSFATLLPHCSNAASVASSFVVARTASAVVVRVAQPVFRRHVRRIALVRCPTSVRQCWRIHCASPLLLFASHDHKCRGSSKSGRNGSGLGSVRSYLHGYCCRPHTLRSPRSSALELAPHSAPRLVVGIDSGKPILAGNIGSGHSAAHVLGCASSSAQRSRDLGHCDRGRHGVIVCSLFVRAIVILAWNATCSMGRLPTRGIRHVRLLSRRIRIDIRW